MEGGVYYINIFEKYYTLLAGTIDSTKDYKCQIINEQFMLTYNEDKRVQIWNIETGEEIYKNRLVASCSCVYFNKKTEDIYCFLENNNEIWIFNLTNLNAIDVFIHDKIANSRQKSELFPIFCEETIISGSKVLLVVMNNGDLYVIDQIEKLRKMI
jgi:WD40 repeat protein